MGTITTLIANHNYAQYIEDAIKSCLEQTIPNNICVVDDGSTDGSWDKVHKLLFKDKQTSVSKTNDFLVQTDGKNTGILLFKTGGPANARNVGIYNTIQQTDYYAILDADDYMYKTKLEKCLKVLTDHPLVGIVYADYNIQDVENNLVRTEFKESFSHPRLLQECIIHSGSVIRKQVLEQVCEATGWYDYRLRCAEDYDLWLRLCDKCLGYHIAEPLTHVRVHSKNSTNSVNQSIWQQCWQLVRDKHQARHAKT